MMVSISDQPRGEGNGVSEIESVGKGKPGLRVGAGLRIALDEIQRYSSEPWRLQSQFADFEDHLDHITMYVLPKRLLLWLFCCSSVFLSVDGCANCVA